MIEFKADYIKYIEKAKALNPLINETTYKLYEMYSKDPKRFVNIPVRFKEDIYSMAISNMREPSWYVNPRLMEYGGKIWSMERPFLVGMKAYLYGTNLFPWRIIKPFAEENVSKTDCFIRRSFSIDGKYVANNNDLWNIDKYTVTLYKTYSKGETLSFIYVKDGLSYMKTYGKTEVSGVLEEQYGRGHESTISDVGFLSPFLDILSDREHGSDMLGTYL